MIRGRILIADDEPPLLDSLCEVLEEEGAEIVGVSNGREAIVSLRRDHFDLVISDVRMPNGDGLAVLREARAAGAVPVILVSGYSDLTPFEALARGAVVLLAKPFGIAELLAHVRRVLSNQPRVLE